MNKSSLLLFALAFISFNLFYQSSSVQADENISDTSIILVIDTSSSMWGTPMDSVKDAARNFVIDIDESVPIAIATFANRAQLVQDYTTDKLQLLETINNIIPDGVTALYDGAMLGVDYAAQSTASNRVVILLSDGAEYGNQSQATRYDAMLYAQSQDILIYSIGLGFGADRSYLEEIANRTNGVFYSAELETDIATIYDQLSAELSNLTPTVIADVTELTGSSIISPITNSNTYTVISNVPIEPRQENGEEPLEPLQDVVSVPVETDSPSPNSITSPVDASNQDTAIVLT
ncbi:MAG: VWA domain-containing protein, partial [Phototrophicaceae bacterium]